MIGPFPNRFFMLYLLGSHLWRLAKRVRKSMKKGVYLIERLRSELILSNSIIHLISDY